MNENKMYECTTADDDDDLLLFDEKHENFRC
jgi:hypothetical protein